MDDIVKQAMAKWPNVPHCYGWLALDARGAWRMRDERAQQQGSIGDKLTQPQLVGFINRNYTVDERGCWYFQNGPQRVYVNLQATPYIARTDPQQGFVVQTGEAVVPDAAWLTEAGELIVRAGDKVAQVDDRDMAQLMGAMELDGKAVADETLLDWVAGGAGTLILHGLPIDRVRGDSLEACFHFVRAPAA